MKNFYLLSKEEMELLRRAVVLQEKEILEEAKKILTCTRYLDTETKQQNSNSPSVASAGGVYD